MRGTPRPAPSKSGRLVYPGKGPLRAACRQDGIHAPLAEPFTLTMRTVGLATRYGRDHPLICDRRGETLPAGDWSR
ncbi:hypothetical protein GGP41_006680 [Bipolaris sorokiniana]|uniref:Uncharacterized protein n=1 Tax=Cochliobolus sativus TaxID=45130 RepID=A0A8H5ZTB9_COCSA|nr:hypothetical protein GGP41_006680 [Bipolaris sorokiniana]